MHSLGFESRKWCCSTWAVHFFPVTLLYYLNMFLNSCHLAHTPFVVLFCHALLDYFICSSGWSLKVLYCLRLTVLWNNRSDEVMEIITVSLADLKKVMKHSVTDANSETFVSIWDWFTHEKSSRLWHDTVSTYNVWTWHSVNIQRSNSYRSRRELYPSLEI